MVAEVSDEAQEAALILAAARGQTGTISTGTMRNMKDTTMSWPSFPKKIDTSSGRRFAEIFPIASGSLDPKRGYGVVC